MGRKGLDVVVVINDERVSRMKSGIEPEGTFRMVGDRMVLGSCRKRPGRVVPVEMSDPL